MLMSNRQLSVAFKMCYCVGLIQIFGKNKLHQNEENGENGHQKSVPEN